MRRLLRWFVPAVLALGAAAGALVAWRSEADVPEGPAAARSEPGLATPVLSVRRLPEVVAAPIAARRLRTDLEALAATLPPETCVSVTGPDLAFAHRAEVAMVPASTQKLLTATAALEVLDPELRFRTRAVVAAPPDGGVLRGDLTLVGGGDPLLATADYVRRFRRQPQVFTDLDGLAAAIAHAGIRRIEGSVRGDESRYDTTRYVAGWPPRYLDQRIIGPLSALSVNDGFHRYPTPDEPGVELEPAPQPAVSAAAVLTRLLEARGVDVTGSPAAGKAPAEGVELAAIESPPVVDVVGQLLRESDITTGELLLKELGREAGDPSTAGGAAVVADVVGPLGTSSVVDGSGLSLEDRVTCDLLVGLLTREGTGAVIRELLPVAGLSGTLEERFRGSELEGVLRGKTGSLRSVAALAGVVEDDDPPLTFSIVVNGEPLPEQAEDLQRQLAEVLASWPRVPDVAVLGPEAVR